MRVAPVAAGALALLDDLSHRGERGLEAPDRDQLRPAQQLGGRLGARGSDEQGALAEAVGQCPQAILDPAVQMPDGREVLAAWHQFLFAQRLARRRRWGRTPRRLGAPSPRGARGRGSAAAHARRTAPGRAGCPTGSSPSAAGSWAGRTRARRRSPPSSWTPAPGGASPRPRSRAAACASARPPGACSLVSPSSVPCLRLNSANRYWHMIMCSSCEASASSHHKSSRFATI